MPAKASSGLEINIFSPESLTDAKALSSFGDSLGLKFSSAKWYSDWSSDFELDMARNFNDQGVIPELSWEPQNGSGGFSYNDVLNGQYDTYLNNFAKSVRSLGFPIRITLAPEMNGDWEPWYVDAHGNSPENFKKFWRYTVDKFRTQGANNVSWIWAPIIHYWGEPCSYAELYPGDSYVDFVGLDGYNWGTTQDWSTWQSFSDIFRSSYDDLVNITSKDVIISEFASTEKGGSKAQWILDMFYEARNNFPRLRGITWFNIDKETDWRINSSDASLEAFKKGARGDYGQITSEEPTPDPPQDHLPNDSKENSQNSIDSNIPTSKTQTFTAPKVETKKTKKYILPFSKTAFYNGKAPKTVLAAKTFKSNLRPYFEKENILILKIIIEFILFSIFLVITWLVDRFERNKNYNQ